MKILIIAPDNRNMTIVEGNFDVKRDWEKPRQMLVASACSFPILCLVSSDISYSLLLHLFAVTFTLIVLMLLNLFSGNLKFWLPPVIWKDKKLKKARLTQKSLLKLENQLKDIKWVSYAEKEGVRLGW